MKEDKERRARYQRTRAEFDELAIEDKAVFLVEATVSTIARGVEEAGRKLAEELDTLFRTEPWAAEAEPEETQPRKSTTARSSSKAKAKPAGGSPASKKKAPRTKRKNTGDTGNNDAS
jgi:hypothetical protein